MPLRGHSEDCIRASANEMGPVRRAIMRISFVVLVLLGIWMILTKNPFVSYAFLIGSVVFFVWLARWTTWKRSYDPERPGGSER